jgi:glutathione synthase/RimK-type ligase-like ATP-grasp enzyme
MKNIILLSTFISITFISCNNNSRTESKPNQEIPKALDNEKSSYDIVSKRGWNEDMVESLYDELSGKMPELSQLEDKIENLRKSKGDSTESFNQYNQKNQVYFSSVNRHIEQIKDVVLRDKMKVLITDNLSKYNSKVSPYLDLLKAIEAKNVALNDLHSILKITRTLPLIEKYQKGNLPTTKSLIGYSKKLNETIQNTDKLIKK